MDKIYIIQVHLTSDTYLSYRNKTKEDVKACVKKLQDLRKETGLLITVVQEHSRNIAAFKTLDEAERYIQQNHGDLSDSGYYDYCLIEEVKLGGYPLSTTQWFYKWEDDKWAKIEMPSWAESTCNFTIG